MSFQPLNVMFSYMFINVITRSANALLYVLKCCLFKCIGASNLRQSNPASSVCHTLALLSASAGLISGMQRNYVTDLNRTLLARVTASLCISHRIVSYVALFSSFCSVFACISSDLRSRKNTTLYRSTTETAPQPCR